MVQLFACLRSKVREESVLFCLHCQQEASLQWLRCLMPAVFPERGGGWPCSVMLKFSLAVSICGLVVHAYTRSLTHKVLVETPVGQRMDPFTKVVICAPFNVKIVPDTEYKVAVTADEVLKHAISTNVRQDTLYIEVIEGFRTSTAIQVTVSLPHDQLHLVRNKAPQSTVAVGQGFNVRRFTALNAGTSTLYLRGMNADEAMLENSGTGRIVANANFRSVQVKGSGVSKLFLKGSLRTIYAHLTGISQVHLDPSSDDVTITGSIQGLSKVHYTRGQCDLGSGQFGNMEFGNMAAGMNSVFGGGCQQVDHIKFPASKPMWSCGMDVSGKCTCAGTPSGSSASASASGNGQTFTSTGNGGAVSMSSSSGGGNSNSNGNSSSSIYSMGESVVRSLACSASEGDLQMFA